MSDASVEFSVLCRLFEAIIRCKKAVLKRKHIHTFLEHVYTEHDYFSAMRLILPDLDKERGNYGLREAVLAKFLTDALGLSKESEDAKKLLNWRKGGQRAGNNAGNFPFVASEESDPAEAKTTSRGHFPQVLYSRQKSAPGGLKIKDVNDLLNKLAAAQDKEEKTAVLAELISKTNAPEMRWILMIILKDLKLGISEKTVFSEFHPDAEDLFNVTCDLKLVCEKLRDRNVRYKRQDIEVGKAVRPQLAARVANVEEAWKKLRGKEVVVECKFDGDRIQVHKIGKTIHFWSRTFNDHSEFKEAIADVLVDHIIPEKCILDGEMLVWDRMTNCFAEFGTNRGVAKAAEDGLDTGQQLCYVVFDILYDGDSSIIHRPLRERQQLLQKAIRPLKGRLELLIPDTVGLNSNRAPGEPCWSILATSAEEVQHFFQETIDNREEGVVLKDMDSKWEPSDRSGKWMKLKPDYIHSESDLDVLIIGGYYGSGRRGGEVAQFLLGIAERPKAGGYPTKFFSFCKVGTGLTNDESEQLVRKLKPYFRRNEKGSKPPSFYVTTNSSKERPDVWIDQPEKSVILQIASDIRTIRSEVFAAPYCLRFPRIQKVRYDKPWYDCLDVQTMVETVHTRSGNGAEGNEEGGTLPKGRAKRPKERKPETQLLSMVPSHFTVTDVSHVKQATRVFKDLVFCFINTPPEQPIEKLHKLVVENGGSFSMNLNSAVTHTIANEKKGIKYQAASRNGDVIHISWLLECAFQKSLLPVGPKYYLHMSDATKDKMKAEIDEFGDFYFIDIDDSDVRQLFENMDGNKHLEHDVDKVMHYTKKYCPTPTWCHFCGCHVFFLRPLHSTNADTQEVATIALKRLELEVGMHEGSVCDTLSRSVTHVVVYTVPESTLPFQTILQSVSVEERRWLKSKKVNVVSQRWIEDALSSNTCRHPAEAEYELRNGEALESEEEEEENKEPTAAAVHTPIKNTVLARPRKRAASSPAKRLTGPKKQVVSRVGRARERRGTEVVGSPAPTSPKPDEAEEAVAKKVGTRRGCSKKKQEELSSESDEKAPSEPVEREVVTEKVLRREQAKRKLKGVAFHSGEQFSSGHDESEEVVKKKLVKRGQMKKKPKGSASHSDGPATSRLDEAAEVARKKSPRRGEHSREKLDSSSESDGTVPKRRLSLEEGPNPEQRETCRASVAKKPPRPRSNRATRNRQVLESDEDENPAPMEVQTEDNKNEVNKGTNTNRSKESHLNDFAQNSVDAMLGDLLPSYYASQKFDLDFDRDVRSSQQAQTLSNQPYNNNVDQVGSQHRNVNVVGEEGNSETSSARAALPVMREGAAKGSEVGPMEGGVTIGPEGAGTSVKKKKVSYKDLVHQMLNFEPDKTM